MNTKPGNKYKLEDLIDIKHFQDLQDQLNKVYPFPSAIIDTDGNILTATAWQEICTDFHRKNKECEKACIQSNKHITERLNEANPVVTYECPHGLVDNAIPIIIDGIHYGNFFTGQSFLEEPDLDFFKKQAKKYNFPEKPYLEAVKKVPIYLKVQLEGFLNFIEKLIAIISESGLKNLKEIETRKKIQDTEKQYRSIIQTAMDGFWLLDIKGNLLEVNDAYCRISGYGRQELLKMSISDIEAVESPEEIANHIQEIMEKGEKRFVRTQRRKNGSLFEVELSVQYQPDNGGGFVCFLRDITESMQLEETLSKSLERLDLATEVAQMGIWDWDIKNNNLVWEDSMYSLYGIQKDNFKDLFESWTEMVHPDDRDNIDKVVDQALHNKMDYDTEYRIFLPDRTIKYIKAIGKVFKNSDGDPLRMIGVNYDITRSKELESQLQQANKMESIGTLAGGIAHDFNNILSPIMMHAEMAMTDLPPNDPLQHCMKEIFISGERARDLVKQILTFARKGSEKRSPVKLSLIVKEAVKFLRATIPTTINIQHDIKSKRDTVLADSTQLNQIIMNLCTNAAHAMREKGGMIEIILDNEDISIGNAGHFLALKPGNYLKLSVIDRGTGIPGDILNRIFEPYYTTKKVGEGTGLGLATVHGIVRNHGGDITVESIIGQGTTFHVYLPLTESKVSVDEEMKTVFPKGNEQILLVDDEKTALKIAQKMLEKIGYKVTTTTESTEALELFRNNPKIFDLVITDMTMPKMTGDILAKEIMVINPGIKIILCTGYSDIINEEKAKEIGISCFLLKPIVMSELSKTIREVLDK